jgi:hypothetical protein
VGGLAVAQAAEELVDLAPFGRRGPAAAQEDLDRLASGDLQHRAGVLAVRTSEGGDLVADPVDHGLGHARQTWVQ